MGMETAAGRHRAVIVTGGRLGRWALGEIRPYDFLIGADKGAEFLVNHGFAPDLALGDFDSVSPERIRAIAATAKEMQVCDPLDKDWTDSELALREAVARGYKEIFILGGLGTRFDHSLANVHLLRQASEQGCEARLLDEHNEIRLCGGECRLEANERFPYVSLLPLTAEAKGVTLTGFRYPLRNATLTLGWSLGVSNVLEQPPGVLTLTEGQLLVIRSRD